MRPLSVVPFVLLTAALMTFAQGQAVPDAPAQPRKVVGFSQVGSESQWRNANTAFMQEEAKRRGYNFRLTTANGNFDKQLADVRALIAQKVEVLVVTPLVSDPTLWAPVLTEAKEAGIPVILQDRRLDVPADLYTAFIGSDYREEGRQAAHWLAQKTGGRAVIFQLQGQAGSAPTVERQRGFEETLKDFPKMEIIRSQSAGFRRADGQQVMAAFLQSPEATDCTAVFAHNDDMALGAIAAIEAAGKRPGTDILIVSVDAIKDAVQAVADGKLNCTVECNPDTAPQIFDAIDILFKRPVPTREGVIDQSQAKGLLPTRKY